MTGKTYAGYCDKGPESGRHLAHYTKSKKFFRPMVPLSLAGDAPVEAIEIGEYRFDEMFGVWNWVPAHNTAAPR